MVCTGLLGFFTFQGRLKSKSSTNNERWFLWSAPKSHQTEILGHVTYTPSPGSVHHLANHFVLGSGLVKGCVSLSETCVTGSFRKFVTGKGLAAEVRPFLLLGQGEVRGGCESGAGPSCQVLHPSGEAGALSGEHVMGPWLLLLGLTMLCLCCSKIKALLHVSGNNVFSVWLYFYSDIQI